MTTDQWFIIIGFVGTSAVTIGYVRGKINRLEQDVQMILRRLLGETDGD